MATPWLRQRWLPALLCLWLLLLNAVASQALAETLHHQAHHQLDEHHHGDQPCPQYDLLKRLTSPLASTPSSVTLPCPLPERQALPTPALFAAASPIPCSRDPPEIHSS
ncbi:hypothetical protein [Ferrimonas senticii]|uniref:hypothetical protein n=1 Tax=Ferrimonas senticii TaxID=394566 RepID=UPI0012EC0E83|nr:hypothetical protein [Ferrimonas senticii]